MTRYRLRLAIWVSVASLLAAGAATGPVRAQPAVEGWTIDRAEDELPLGDAVAVVVDNPLGDVRARGGDDDRVSWLAVRQVPEGHPAPPAVEARRESGKLLITVRAPAPTDPANGGTRADAPEPRVDLSLFVPDGATFEVTTRDGLVDAKGLAGDVVARSRKGNLRLITAGTVDAYSERGEVMIHWTGASWRRPPAVETVTGAIELWLPRDADADVTIETAGLLTTDYSISVDHRDDRATKIAHATLGAGRTSLRVRSARGDVRLLRSPLRPAEAGSPAEGSSRLPIPQP